MLPLGCSWCDGNGVAVVCGVPVACVCAPHRLEVECSLFPVFGRSTSSDPTCGQDVAQGAARSRREFDRRGAQR
jgi:hypothetical protein